MEKSISGFIEQCGYNHVSLPWEVIYFCSKLHKPRKQNNICMTQLLAALSVGMNALPINAPMGASLISFQMFK